MIYAVLILALGLFSAGTSPHVKQINRVTHQFTKQLKKEKGLDAFGYGGRMMDDIKEVALSLAAHHPMTIEEARCLFVEIVEEYLNLVNSDLKLRPYLHNYPFTVANLDFDFGLLRELKTIQPGQIGFVYYLPAKDCLCYRGYDPQKEEYYSIFEETYAEAVERAHETREKQKAA